MPFKKIAEYAGIACLILLPILSYLLYRDLNEEQPRNMYQGIYSFRIALIGSVAYLIYLFVKFNKKKWGN